MPNEHTLHWTRMAIGFYSPDGATNRKVLNDGLDAIFYCFDREKLKAWSNGGTAVVCGDKIMDWIDDFANEQMSAALVQGLSHDITIGNVLKLCTANSESAPLRARMSKPDAHSASNRDVGTTRPTVSDGMDPDVLCEWHNGKWYDRGYFTLNNRSKLWELTPADAGARIRFFFSIEFHCMNLERTES